MNDPLEQMNALLKAEADEILRETGLSGILNAYGRPHLTGSYALDLMTWRDLDIYLQVETLSEVDFFALGAQVCKALTPVKMSFRNELVAKTPGLPAGLYWGIYLGNERAGAWKIDLWAVSPPECQRLLRYCAALHEKLTPETVTTILAIKSRCWSDPEYRRSFGSTDIYRAVLEKKITGIEGFKHYLREQKRTP